jgi:hypothetical protein
MRTCKVCGLPRPEPGEVCGYSGPVCQGYERPHQFEPMEQKTIQQNPISKFHVFDDFPKGKD